MFYERKLPCLGKRPNKGIGKKNIRVLLKVSGLYADYMVQNKRDFESTRASEETSEKKLDDLSHTLIDKTLLFGESPMIVKSDDVTPTPAHAADPLALLAGSLQPSMSV